MNLIDRLNTSYNIVCDKSKNVKINYDKIDDMIVQINNSKVDHWLDSNPYDLMNMNIKEIINFLFVYHSIGNYCFWGDPKWEIQTDFIWLLGQNKSQMTKPYHRTLTKHY